MIIVDLVYNLAVLIAISIISGFINARFNRTTLIGKILQGFLFGSTAIIGMHNPFVLSQGIIFDGRSIVISLSALFFGPLAGGIAAGMAFIYRIMIGGSGILMGTGVIITSFLIGYIFFIQKASTAHRKISNLNLFQFGLLVHIAMLVLVLLLPVKDILYVYKTISFTVILIYPLVTLLVGRILLDQEENILFVKKLSDNEERLRLSLKAGNQGLYDLNVQTGEAFVNDDYAAMLGYDPKTFVESNSAWIERLHPDDKDITAKAYLDYTKGKTQEYRVEFRQRTKDNRWKWILSTGKIVEYDFDGSPLRMLGTHTDITELKETHQALQISEEKFAKMFRSSPDTITLSKLTNGLIVDVNEACLEKTGYARNEIIGKTVIDLNLWADINDRDKYVTQLMNQGRITNFETRFRMKSGELRDALISGEVIELVCEKFILGTIRDITDRKEIEKTLFENQMRLQSIVSNAPVILFGLDSNGVFTFSEGKGLQTLGLKPGEVVGKSAFEVYRDFPSLVQILKRALKGELQTGIHEMGDLTFEVYYTPIKSQAGNITGVIGVATDITERKKSEEKVRSSEERYRTLVESMDISLCRWLPDTTLTFTNEKYRQIFGLTPEMANRKWLEFVPEETRAETTRFYEELAEDPKVMTYEHPVKLKDGGVRDYHWIDMPIKNEQGVLTEFQSVGIDITERKKAEKELEESHTNLVTTLESMRDGFISLDSDWRYTYMNNIAGQIFGRNPAEIIGKHIWTEFPEGMGQPFHLAYEKAMKEQEPIFLEEYFSPYNKWFENRIYPTQKGLSIFFTDITERKISEQKLRESEAKYRLLIENQSELIIKVSKEGKILFVSPSYCKLFGKTEDELLNNSFMPLVHEDDRPITEEVMKDLYKPPYYCYVEQRAKTVDGWRWIAWADTAILNENDEVVEIIGVGRDITARKESESVILTNEKRFRAAFNNAPIGIALVSLDEKFLSVNEALCNILGYSEEELLEKTVPEITHPDDIQTEAGYKNKMISGEIRSFQFDKRYFHSDGHLVWGTLNVSAVTDEKGHPIYYIGQLEDITDRKNAIEALRESENKFKTIFDSTPVPLALNDNEQNITLLNKAFIETFGYTKEDIPTLDVWWPKAYPDAGYRQWVASTWQNRINESRQTGEPFEPIELKIRCKDGSFRTSLVGLSLLGNQDTSEQLVILYDITERKRADEEKLFLSNALEASLNEIYIFDSVTLRFTDVNHGAIKNLGYSKNELLNFTPLDLKPDFTYDSFEKVLLPLKEGKEKQIMFETRHRRADDTLYPVEVYLQLFKHGDRSYFLAVINDITERKRAEKEIQKKNEDLAKLFEISVNLLESIDKKTTLNKIVENAVSLIGLDSGAIYLLEDNELILEATTPALLEDFPEEFRKAKLEHHRHIQKSIKEEVPIIISDSSEASLSDEEKIILQARNLKSLIYLPLIFEKQVVGIIILGTIEREHKFTEHEIELCRTLANLASLSLENSILFDKLNKNVSDLKRAIDEKNITTQALTESEARFHTMFEKHHAIMMLIEPESGKIVDANLSAEKFYGYHISELRKMNIGSINQLSPSKLKEELNKASSESKMYFNFPHKLHSGEIKYVEVFTTPITVKDVTLLFSIIHDITERRIAEQEVLKSQQQLRALTAKLEQIREEERIHLSRELHDNLGQSLTGLKMDVAWLARNMSKKKPESVEDILGKTKSMSELIDQTINNVRRISSDLRPNLLDYLGLVAALEWLISDFKKRTEINCKIISKVKNIKLDAAVTNSVYRIIQEGLTNIARHSGAKKVELEINQTDKHFVIQLSDDGSGITKEQINKVDSLGIRGMKERVIQFGGELTFKGTKGRGTVITLNIPKGK